MDVEIVKKDGSVYRLSDFGVVYDFVVGSISIEQYSDRVEGRSGLVDYGADYSSRTIKVPMKFKHREMHEYAHLRDELYGILTDTQSYYIRELRRPKRLEYEFVDFGGQPKYKPQTDDRYVNGKQYLVRMTSELEPEQLYNGGEIEIDFQTTELPFAESIYTTSDLHESNFVDIAEKYGLADNIRQDKTSYKFKYGVNQIWNAGNVAVTPENMYLVIKLKGVNSNGNLTIENKSTNEKFIYYDKLSNKDLTIDGVQVNLGSINSLRKCNRNMISIKPGLNNIDITGATFKEAIFDFKFYYK